MVESLVELFPCGECAEHFMSVLKDHPPPRGKERSKADVELWLCEMHNVVNERLGKRIVECDIDELRTSFRLGSA